MDILLIISANRSCMCTSYSYTRVDSRKICILFIVRKEGSIIRPFARRILTMWIPVIIIACLIPVDGKGMWGARRKRSPVEDSATTGQSTGSDTQSSPEILKDMPKVDSDMIKYLEEMLNIMDEYVNSPDFDTTISPDFITSMVREAVPTLADRPELQSLWDFEPAVLKMKVKEGLAMSRKVLKDLPSLLEDPEKLLDIITASLPPDVVEALNSAIPDIQDILSESGITGEGDVKSTMESILDAMRLLQPQFDLPSSGKGVGGEQEQAPFGSDVLMSMLQKFSDPIQVELVRQHLLEQPELAQMLLGVSADILRSKEKFADFVSSLASGDIFGSIGPKKKRKSSPQKQSYRAQSSSL